MPNNFVSIGGACVPSVNNSTSAPLAASQVFTGAGDFIIDFAEITLTLFAEPATATGTLWFEFSQNGVHWDLSVPLSVQNPSLFIPFPLRIVTPYFRVRYVNGSIAQTEFRLGVLYHRTGVKQITRLPSQVLGVSEPVDVVRAVVEPSIASRHLLTSADRAVFGAAITANRLAYIATRFDRPLAQNQVATVTVGGATVTQADGQVVLASSAALTANALLESSRRVQYSPANEIYAIFTARFTTPTHVNSHQRIGLYDDQNVFFIGYNGLNFGHTRRRAGVDTFFPKATIWNGDPVDGSGFSSFTRAERAEFINFTRFNIYRIRFGWLGSASVLFEVMAPDGHWVVLHTATVPNALSVPHITSPVLPVRAEVVKASADATVLELGTCSWNAGTTEDAASFTHGDLRGRTIWDASLTGQTADATVRATPSGRIARVTTLMIQAENTDSVIGKLNVTDGAVVKVPVQVPRGTTGNPTSVTLPLTFPQPLEFTTGIGVDVVAGTLTYSIMIAGYDIDT